MENNQNSSNDPLDNDHEENMRMENELLRLKLKAELGADSHNSGNLNPAIENEFLRQVLAFEHNYTNVKRSKVFDLIGRPDFKRSGELGDDMIDPALNALIALLSQKNILVDFSGTYDSRTQYSFITEELFDHETDDFRMPGMITHFCYEEFHPNHKLDIENRTLEFLSGWFEKKLSENHWELADTFILPDGKTLTKKEIAEKLKQVFDSYNTFTDCKYIISDIGFKWQNESGLGHAEGHVEYNALLENNEKLNIKGHFKLYLSSEFGWWSIFYFVFPGFEY
jgi:hypothetical protein